MKFRLLIALALVLSVVAIGQNQTQKELEQKQSQIERKASQLRGQLRANSRERSQKLRDIRRTDVQIGRVTGDLGDTTQRLQEGREDQARLGDELEELSLQLGEKKERVGRRLRALYMQGDPSPLSIFIGADSLEDVADRAFIMQKIADADRQMVEDLKQARSEVNDRKWLADRFVERIAALRVQQVSQTRELSRHRQTKRAQLRGLESEKRQLEVVLDELEKASRAVEAELRKYHSKPSNVPVWRGNLTQPVSGRISSGYGMRRHPFKGGRRMHTGIDIAAASGTPIKASGDGRVVSASYRNGYGNTVIIDHGGGVTTLYAHCSKLYVKAGQSVKQGEKIAAVGSTGLSTGPHVHWEVRINGKPVNPRGR
ncbi:MAG: peptidoglycan DD-metalloendopeptidase family protein [Armatimonadetes bacterium]|nr:peptidoglycan DD-metalloendopeptidase family protein [Armatimonadota bacterium]